MTCFVVLSVQNKGLCCFGETCSGTSASETRSTRCVLTSSSAPGCSGKKIHLYYLNYNVFVIKFVQKTSTHFCKIITSSAVCSVFSVSNHFNSTRAERCLSFLSWGVKEQHRLWPLLRLFTEVTKVRRNLFNQEIVSPSKKAKLPRSQSVSAVEGLKRKRSHESEGDNPLTDSLSHCSCSERKINLVYLVFFVPRETQTPDKESVWNTPSQAGVQSPSVPAENGKVCASALI